jgi:hypothetical protein
LLAFPRARGEVLDHSHDGAREEDLQLVSLGILGQRQLAAAVDQLTTDRVRGFQDSVTSIVLPKATNRLVAGRNLPWLWDGGRQDGL